MASYNVYTTEQEDFLRKHHLGKTRKELTEMFNETFKTNKTVMAIKGWCNNRGLKSGVDTKFAKGHRSWQTGLSKDEFKQHYTEENFEKMIVNIKDRRTHKIGDTFVKSGIVYVLTSTESHLPIERRAQAKRRYVYEQAYGKIPPRHRIVHLDGDKFNCELDNLYCIPNQFVPVLNKYRWLSKNRDITMAGIKWCELFNALKDSEKD